MKPSERIAQIKNQYPSIMTREAAIIEYLDEIQNILDKNILTETKFEKKYNAWKIDLAIKDYLFNILKKSNLLK